LRSRDKGYSLRKVLCIERFKFRNQDYLRGQAPYFYKEWFIVDFNVDQIIFVRIIKAAEESEPKT